jgi:hypothetical protein
MDEVVGAVVVKEAWEVADWVGLDGTECWVVMLASTTIVVMPSSTIVSMSQRLRF